MRHTEFWARMEHALGPAYAADLGRAAGDRDLGHRTVVEALDAGETPKQVWRAVWERLEPPARRSAEQAMIAP